MTASSERLHSALHQWTCKYFPGEISDRMCTLAGETEALKNKVAINKARSGITLTSCARVFLNAACQIDCKHYNGRSMKSSQVFHSSSQCEGYQNFPLYHLKSVCLSLSWLGA